MKIDQGRTASSQFEDACKKDNDPFLVVHFSRDEDKYDGRHDGLDFADALIIVGHLCNHFKLNPAMIETSQSIAKRNEDLMPYFRYLDGKTSEIVSDSMSVDAPTPEGYKCPLCGNEVSADEVDYGDAPLCLRCPNGEYTPMEPV